MAVRHGPFLLIWKKKKGEKKDPGFQNHVPGETCLHLLLGAQDHRLGVEQDKVPCGSTRTSSGNCQETEIDLHHMHVCVCVCVCVSVCSLLFKSDNSLQLNNK